MFGMFDRGLSLKLQTNIATDRHTQTTTEISKGMKDVNTSNVSHVSRKSSQCMKVTAPDTQVTLPKSRSEATAMILFSNATKLSSTFFNSGENNIKHL